MKFLSACILTIFLSNFVYANDPDSVISLQGAINKYRSGPMTDEGYKAGQFILKFAQESDSVLIEVNTDKLPWVSDKSVNQDVAPQMLLAYIVGNVDSQLKKGIAVDSHCAGIEEVSSLLVYLEGEGISSEFLSPAHKSMEKAAEACKKGTPKS